MDAEIWSLGARYCLRQNAHAYMWLLGLFLAFAGTAFVAGRRGRRLETGVLAFFAIGTAALGCAVAYGCFVSAGPQMGYVAPGADTTHLEALTCLGRDAFGTAITWTIVALSCCGAFASIVFSRSRGSNALLRVGLYLGAALLLLVAAAAGSLADFAFSWCTSNRLF